MIPDHKYCILGDKNKKLKEIIIILNSEVVEMINFSAIAEIQLKNRNISETDYCSIENKLDSFIKRHDTVNLFKSIKTKK